MYLMDVPVHLLDMLKCMKQNSEDKERYVLKDSTKNNVEWQLYGNGEKKQKTK